MSITNLKEEFNREREHWAATIKEIVQKLRTVEQIVTMEVERLSLRQDLVEELHVKRLHMQKIKIQKIDKEKDAFEDVSTKSQLLLNSFAEKNILIRQKLKGLDDLEYLYETHIKFIEDSIKTLDNLGYAVKTRMQIYTSEGL